MVCQEAPRPHLRQAKPAVLSATVMDFQAVFGGGPGLIPAAEKSKRIAWAIHVWALR